VADPTVPVVGVDGCRAGWVACLLAPGGAVTFGTNRALADVLCWAAAEGAAAVGVDVPVGLPSGPDGWRRADLAARRLLGPAAAARVFLTPTRSTAEAWRAAAGLPYRERYAEARAAAPPGMGLSAQAAGLLDKVLEADGLARAGAAFVEVHPELSFRAMAGEVLPGKRSQAGRARRLVALAAGVPAVESDLVRDDDHADAAAVAWSAARLAAGTARSVPAGEPPLDEVGLPMRISW
jgi:predicted RNase H-like nuclease